MRRVTPGQPAIVSETDWSTIKRVSGFTVPQIPQTIGINSDRPGSIIATKNMYEDDDIRRGDIVAVNPVKPVLISFRGTGDGDASKAKRLTAEISRATWTANKCKFGEYDTCISQRVGVAMDDSEPGSGLNVLVDGLFKSEFTATLTDTDSISWGFFAPVVVKLREFSLYIDDIDFDHYLPIQLIHCELNADDSVRIGKNTGIFRISTGRAGFWSNLETLT